MEKSKLLPLFFILILAFFLRIYGINWDQGFHLHPDERMLIMVADRIHFFNRLDPDFFNYGSLPIYLLKGSTQLIDYLLSTSISNYGGMLLFGRTLSITADVLIVLLIYSICNLLFKQRRIALFSCFFYSIIFFPIQNSHFFVADVFLNLFITLLIYLLLLYLKKSSTKLTLLISIVFAAMMATKFTAIIFYPIIISIILLKIIRPGRKLLKQFSNLLIYLIIFNFLFFIFYFLFMPYAFLNYQQFIKEVSAQVRMNSDPYTFPYTLQYVGSLPYLYYIKNIFLWGLGPIISILTLIGGFKLGKLLIFNSKFLNVKHFLFVCFYLLYFLIIGRSAVKFMRYMLPLYPFFAIITAYGFSQISRFGFRIFFLFLIVLWTFIFINIYSQQHSRITATDWILKNISYGSTIATEHWDDGLPLKGGENYKHEELTLYDQPDNEEKWNVLNEKLKRTDYIIIASNRLYVPLQKLTDCNKYKVCYSKTAEYYKKLFAGKLGFTKVAEFSVYPRLEIGSWKLEICDDAADESFTVYDHPKIMIFKRI